MTRKCGINFVAAACLLILPISNGGLLAGRAMANDLIAQDLNDDGRVNQSDWLLLQPCLLGSAIPHDGTPTCQAADVDQDGDVDLSDFGIYQRCMSGPLPADPACGGCAMPEGDLPVGASSNEIPIGVSSDLVVDDTQVGANYQLRDDADDSLVGDPVAGTGGSIFLPTGPLSADTTFNVLAINALWACSVELLTTQTITVFPYEDNNKIGVHIVQGSRNGFGPFLADTAAAGKPVAVVKGVDDYAPCAEAKGYSTDTVTIGRQNTYGGFDLGNLGYRIPQGTAADAAQWFYNLVEPNIWRNHKTYVDYWELCNEWDSDYTFQADFYIAMMDLAGPDGYKLALWSSSVGTPHADEYPEVARTCLRAKSGGHIMSLHEYAFFCQNMRDPCATMMLRYRDLYDYLATQNAVVPLALTEVGQGGGYDFVGTADFIADYAWYDTKMREDWYVLGCAAWTLGNWGNANFQNALPALADYIVAH